MEQKDKRSTSEEGVEVMSSWVIIILAYMIIAVGLFNMVDTALHPLFWN
jgi:hypothetical protein